MTPAQMRGVYARMMARSGETISLVRGFGGGSPVTVTGIRARSTGYQADEVVGAIQQGERRFILLAEDVEGTALVEPQVNDRVVWRGRNLAVKEVHDATRRVGGTAIAYEVRVQGG